MADKSRPIVSKSISAKLAQYFPFLHRRTSSLPRGEMLALRPLRNITVTWEMKTDAETPGATLTMPRRESGYTQILSRIFQIPATKTIELDEFGAAVWEKCDGKHSVENLVGFTSRTYKLNRRQAEVSVVSFMRMLAQRRLIGLEKIPKTAQNIGQNIGQNTAKETAHGSQHSKQRAPVKRGRRRH